MLSGVAPLDQISINYAAPASEKDARADLYTLARVSGWAVKNGRVSSRSTPGQSGPIVSSLFYSDQIVDAKSGILPIEPFVVTLKRFGELEITYVQTPPMRFRGLEDFENRLVKIQMSRTGGSYRYRVRIKDGSFERLDLPLTQAAARAPEPAVRAGPRVFAALLHALLGAAAAFVLASWLLGRRRPRTGTDK